MMAKKKNQRKVTSFRHFVKLVQDVMVVLDKHGNNEFKELQIYIALLCSDVLALGHFLLTL